MRYLSLFSGIEAATVAWEPLGFEPVAFCEIDPFASAVIAHRFPETPNLGDVQEADFDAIGPVDLAVFGSPCQSYSVAGKRLGLDDPRGNLALVAGQVVFRKRPRWFVFENVPGLLSSDSGWDFGTLLAAFAGYKPGTVFEPPADGWKSSGVVVQAEGGYGLAWRVLDAQYFGLAQRRKRVFVVGYLGDWRRAAAVLFERESLSRNSPPRREAREDVAPTIAARTRGGGGLGTDFDCDGGLIASTGDVSHCLNAGGMGRIDYESETLCVEKKSPGLGNVHGDKNPGVGAEKSARRHLHGKSPEVTQYASGALPLAFSCKDHGADAGEVCPSLRAMGHDGSHANAGGQVAVAFDMRGREGGAMPEGPHDTANLRAASGGSSRSYVATPWAVRRLTPREAERLQGFPDDFTLIDWSRRARIEKISDDVRKYYERTGYTGERLMRAAMCPDGPRYKALGNAMAVPVMRWIGERIAMADAIQEREAA